MIYLDSAATTLQKPSSVPRAAANAISRLASPGRGEYRAAMDAAAVSFTCRQTAAALFGVENPEQIVFTSNATHGLNIAVHTLIRPGDRVVISGWEHNAVTRPLYASGAEVIIAAAPLFDMAAQLHAFEEALDERVRAVVCTHVSNVFGAVQPVEEVAALCHRYGIAFIVDASQSAGCLPVRQNILKADFIAMPGHKGLYGPQGTGILICGGETRPLMAGGTGSASSLQAMPPFLPDRLEAGTHNMPGIAGLLEGLRYVQKRGTESILKRERTLIHQAIHGMSRHSRIRMFAADERDAQTGVLSFRVEGLDCETVGERLGMRGIAVRAGLHCAPLAHRTAGTLEEGTVRVSVSDFNTTAEMERMIWEISRL